MKTKEQINKLEKISMSQERIKPNVSGYSAGISFGAGVIPQNTGYTKYNKDIKPNISGHSASVGFGASVIPVDMEIR